MAGRRDALRLTMRAAAKLGGLSATAWSDLEAGKQAPSATTQRAVAKALGWGFDWLDYAQRGETPPLSQPDALAELRALVADLSDRLVELERQVEVLTDDATERASALPVLAPRPASQGFA